MISIKVPARICFFGDHQDYLGLPVIAGSINRFIYLNAQPIPEKEFHIRLKDIDDSITLSLDDTLDKVNSGDYYRSGMAVLKQKGFRFSQGYSIVVEGNVPVNAGLSSSSALVVAWLRFLIAIQKEKRAVTDAEIGHWAYETEVTYFNQPGGLMDQYTIAQQGLLFIDTKEGKTKRLQGNLGKLVVAESGISKETLGVLQNGRAFQENAIQEVQAHHPDFKIQDANIDDYERYLDLISEEYKDHWYAAIHNFNNTMEATAQLKGTEDGLKELGRLMDEHQTILENRIQNTPKAMIRMMEAARGAGALGAKIIGSGGGGCMVAMVTNDSKIPVINAFLESGAKAAYEVELTYPNL